MDSKQLCRDISAHDFAMHELTLYLDTHPTDTMSLQKRRDLMSARDALIEQHKTDFGSCVRTDDCATAQSADTWMWVNDPWPWEYCPQPAPVKKTNRGGKK